MAKTFITDSLTGSRIPFLRGILIRSLQDSGLPFDKAYEISSLARDGLTLTHKTEFQSMELREIVVDLLAKDGFFRYYRSVFRSFPACRTHHRYRTGWDAFRFLHERQPASYRILRAYL